MSCQQAPFVFTHNLAGLTQPLILSASLGLPWLRAWRGLEPRRLRARGRLAFDLKTPQPTCRSGHWTLLCLIITTHELRKTQRMSSRL